MKPHGRARLRRHAAVAMAVLLLFPLLGLLFQTLGAAVDNRRYPPPGELVDVGGFRLHLHCEGTGSPVVVLDAGMGDDVLHWWHVQQSVARFTRVCSYDRAGLGWSEPGPAPRSASRVADELKTLLASAGIPQPYVLVGHSFGAFTAHTFASRHPDATAGVVLVDAADAEWWLSPQGHAQAQANARERRRQANLARFGLARAYGALMRIGVAPPPAGARGFIDAMPPGIVSAQVSIWSRVQYYEAVADQWEAMAASAETVLAAGDLGSLLLIVVTAGTNRTHAQEALAQLSTRGTQVIAERSGHDIHIEQPQVVTAAIRDLVEQARYRR